MLQQFKVVAIAIIIKDMKIKYVQHLAKCRSLTALTFIFILNTTDV